MLALPHLTALDLRENCLELSASGNRAAVASVLALLTALCSLGICGNWDAKDRAR
jgi:hypothetical protein